MLEKIRSFLDWRYRRRVNARIKALRHVETTTSAAPIPAENALAGTAHLGERDE